MLTVWDHLTYCIDPIVAIAWSKNSTDINPNVAQGLVRRPTIFA
jgi:hypothetical protein